MRWSTVAPAAVRCGIVSMLVAAVGCQALQQADLSSDDGSSGAPSDGTGPGPTTAMPTSSSGGTSAAPDSDTNSVDDEGSTTAAGTSTPGSTGDGDTSTTRARSTDSTSGETGDTGDSGETSSGETGDTGPGETGESSSSGECSPSGPGTWANCPVGDMCNDPQSFCLSVDDVVGVDVDGICGFPCSDACDCPPAPNTGDAVVTCGDFGGENSCYLSCADSETCPADTQCFADFACAYDNVIVVNEYEGCDTPNYACPVGSVCAGNGASSSCLPQGCMNPGSCPSAVAGTVGCGDANGMGPNDCYIDCGGPLDCPAGWSCVQGFLCLQTNP